MSLYYVTGIDKGIRRAYKSGSMAKRTKILTLGEAVGQQIREQREDADVTQEAIAASARNTGLRHWVRATVAQLELGSRDLTSIELLLMPVVLYGVGIRIELADLLPADANIEVRAHHRSGEVPHRTYVAAKTLQRIASGEARAAIKEMTTDHLDRVARDAPDVLAGETEQRAANRLGVTVRALRQTAMRLWRRTLAEERERRLVERDTAGMDSRKLQAMRGHITRQLLAEIEAAS